MGNRLRCTATRPSLSIRSSASDPGVVKACGMPWVWPGERVVLVHVTLGTLLRDLVEQPAAGLADGP
jgi:hypothetical protein